MGNNLFRRLAAIAVGAMAGTCPAATMDFGGQSMGTTRAVTLRVQAAGLGAAASVPFEMVSSHPQFVVSQGTCTALRPTPCNVTVTFQPGVTPGAVNGTVAAAATIEVRGTDPLDVFRLDVAGTAERSLVTHFYQQILEREPDATGKHYWEAEAARMVAGGVDVKEVWYVMSKAFAASPEAQQKAATALYLDVDYVDWLYRIYFNRDADAAGLAYWTGQLGTGLTRENAQLAFMLSPEFTSMSTSLFGSTSARAELGLVGDFYRGLLGRLPDDAGLAYWIARLRAAQCSGPAAVRAEADALSSLFLESAEYGQRNRGNSQLVTDLYDAFLRRGPDIPGADYWVALLNSGGFSRQAARAAFLASPEFTGRVDAVVAAGCLP